MAIKDYLQSLVSNMLPSFLKFSQEIRYTKEQADRFSTTQNIEQWKGLVHNATELAHQMMENCHKNASLVDTYEAWEQYSYLRRSLNIEFGKSHLVPGYMRTIMW
jgi:hypothetical protein